MKKTNLFAIALMIVATALTACGVKKTTPAPVQQTGYYQQPAQPVQTQPQPAQTATPTRTQRELDKCALKALEPTDHLRAWSSAVSYVEDEALRIALQNARNELANMIKTQVSGAAERAAKTVNVDKGVTSGITNDADYVQYVYEQVSNAPMIETSIYDLQDGKIQVYVCIEMRASEKDFSNKIAETVIPEVGADKILELEYYKKEFKKEHKEGMDAYIKQRRQEAGLE